MKTFFNISKSFLALIFCVALGVSVAEALAYSLLPDAAGTRDVGSSTKYWDDFFGNKLNIRSGTNLKIDDAVCNGATGVDEANSSVTANSLILFSLKTVGGTVGAMPTVQTITPATGFNFKCTASDTSTYRYVLIERF